MKNVDIQDDKIIEDACKLLKSDFVAIYKEMGYDESSLKVDWHRIRTSAKGRERMDELYKGIRHIQALTTVSIPKEEAQIKTANMTKAKAKSDKKAAPAAKPAKKTAVAVEKPKAEKVEKAAKVEKPKAEKVKAEKAPKDGERGKITAAAKELIAQGETSAKIISEKSGVALAYARTLLYNARKLAPKAN